MDYRAFNLLTDTEKDVIRRYRKHLFEVSKISLDKREVLFRIIMECGQELNIIERDLKHD